MKTLLTAVAAAVFGSVFSLTLIGQAQPARTPSAVAYVSPNRILNESVHGRTEAARLQTLQQQRTTELRGKQQALETTRQQLSTVADAAARQELAQRENAQRTDLERSTVQFQTDLTALQREVNTDMQRRVRTILDELMKTQAYQLVINDGSVLWSAPELDLTTAVIGRMNATP
jgi:Skp family chaperone for outer membrane proteins